MRAFRFLAAAAVSLAAGSAAQASISSTFDAGNEGWGYGDIVSTSTPTRSGDATYFATGGNPGGYIHVNDDANEVAFFAPAAYTGNLASYYGGTASFDIYDTGGEFSGQQASIVLYSGGQSIAFGFGSATPTFTHYDVPLTEAGWFYYAGGGLLTSTPVSHDAFLGFLGAVDIFTIHADLHPGSDDTGLDNVLLAAGAVPEPASWTMMLAGLGMAGGVMRHRRRTAARLA